MFRNLDQRKVALKEADGTHTGFCLGTYDYCNCADCLCEKECIDLFEKEQKQKEEE